jgi:GntR family transcriptional regulator, transcriptional repressor for pyruvate dehydrogenase complex
MNAARYIGNGALEVVDTEAPQPSPGEVQLEVAFAADEEFHRIVVTASGNSTLASLIQNVSGGTLRARLWRSVKERDAVEVTKRRHWDIYNALRDRDAKRAAAADLIHLSEGEQWLRQLMQAEDALTVLAIAPPDTDLSGNGDENAGSTR